MVFYLFVDILLAFFTVMLMWKLSKLIGGFGFLAWVKARMKLR
ncbi:hypothetical protein VVMO6_00584 [Vibrio vulnificus MO6-24/O]|nr:hypothetical protein VVMO6_00584 [Vibrio vulnificus MO6-24/O]